MCVVRSHEGCRSFLSQAQDVNRRRKVHVATNKLTLSYKSVFDCGFTSGFRMIKGNVGQWRLSASYRSIR